MTRRLSLCAAALTLALPASVAAQETSAEAAIIQAFLQFDCVMTRENEDAVVAAMGLSEADSDAAGQAMFAQGLFEEVDGQLVMLHPDCPNAGAAAAPAGPDAATDWMASLSPDQNADVLAEIMAARGCVIGPDEFGWFQGEIAAAVGRRFGFDETALPLEQMDPFLDALERMSERGMIQLVRDGRLEDGPGGRTLVGCDAAQ